MTTRRGFLGMLAAAPVVVPLVAKEALASGGYVRSISGSLMVGEAINIEMDMPQLKAFRTALDNQKPPTQALRDLMQHKPIWEMDARSCTCHPDEAPIPCARRYAHSECVAAVPNRLKGAYLLESGDAA